VTLRFGVFDDFKGAMTLLIWGDKEQIAQLRDVFDELADGRRTVAALNDMPWAAPVGGARLDLSVAKDGRDEMLVTSSAVSWRCSREHFAEFADKVAALLGPGAVISTSTCAARPFGSWFRRENTTPLVRSSAREVSREVDQAADRTGLRIFSHRSRTMPSCRSSDQSVSQPALRARRRRSTGHSLPAGRT
jgi:hypothetical protein